MEYELSVSSQADEIEVSEITERNISIQYGVSLVKMKYGPNISLKKTKHNYTQFFNGNPPHPAAKVLIHNSTKILPQNILYIIVPKYCRKIS